MRNFWIIVIVFFFVCGCREYKRVETEEVKSGELACVHKIGIKDSYAEEKRYNLGTKVYFAGELFAPDDYKNFNEFVAGCEASPDKSVTALKISGVEYEKGGMFLLRIENKKAVLTKIADYRSESDGEWTGDGRWLLFKDYFINVETGERRDIKSLPRNPNYLSLVGISPDLKTVVMYGKQDDEFLGLMLIDTETGQTTEPKFERAKYEWLLDRTHAAPNTGAAHIWISNQFKWEKDASGKDRLVYPSAVVEKKKTR